MKCASSSVMRKRWLWKYVLTVAARWIGWMYKAIHRTMTAMMRKTVTSATRLMRKTVTGATRLMTKTFGGMLVHAQVAQVIASRCCRLMTATLVLSYSLKFQSFFFLKNHIV